eukprot:PhM_4_TR14966/c0_g1_i1/m.68596
MSTAPTRRRTSSVDMHRRNLMQIREQEQMNKERSKQAEYQQHRVDQQRAALREKLNVANVKSNVDTSRGTATATATRQQQQQPCGSTTDDNVTIEVFVNECDPALKNYFSYDESDNMMQKGTLPTAPPRHAAGGAGVALRRQNSSAGRVRAPSQQQQQQPPHKAGAVPEYLQRRKAELKAVKDEIQRVANEEAERAKYPPGKRPLTDEEQRAILSSLQSKKEELEQRLAKVPMRYDNPSLQRRRQEMEDEIVQVEEEIRKFSRKNIFVPVDALF